MVILLLIGDHIIYRKLAEDMINKYTMGQDNCPRTLPKMKNILVNWRNSARTIPRPPNGGLAFTHERTNNEGAVPTNGVHGRIPGREELDISTVKFYNCNLYSHYSNK